MPPVCCWIFTANVCVSRRAKPGLLRPQRTITSLLTGFFTWTGRSYAHGFRDHLFVFFLKSCHQFIEHDVPYLPFIPEQAAWRKPSARSAVRFHGSSSSMRLIGCSAMHDRTFRR